MKKTTRPHLLVEANSHPGMTGKKNEDRFGVSAFTIPQKQNIPVVLAVLCDGIGGHRAGEVAAEMGVSIITERVAASNGRHPLKTLEEAIYTASEAIYKASQADQGRSGMGATCACAWVMGDRLYTANLGDSRIYLLRRDDFIQLTTDHTWVQEALEAGLIAAADAEEHPNAHVIRRYLGSKSVPRPDFRLWIFEGEDDNDALANQGLQLNPGDTVLLCSDGLTDLVSDEEIRGVLKSHELGEVPEILIGMANDRGGHDNTTVVVMQMPAGKLASRQKQRFRWLVLGCLGTLVLAALLITALVLGLRWREGRDMLNTPLATQLETLPEPWLTPTPSSTIIEAPSPTISPEPTEDLGRGETTITPWPTNPVPGE